MLFGRPHKQWKPPSPIDPEDHKDIAGMNKNTNNTRVARDPNSLYKNDKMLAAYINCDSVWPLYQLAQCGSTGEVTHHYTDVYYNPKYVQSFIPEGLPSSTPGTPGTPRTPGTPGTPGTAESGKSVTFSVNTVFRLAKELPAVVLRFLVSYKSVPLQMHPDLYRHVKGPTKQKGVQALHMALRLMQIAPGHFNSPHNDELDTALWLRPGLSRENVHRALQFLRWSNDHIKTISAKMKPNMTKGVKSANFKGAIRQLPPNDELYPGLWVWTPTSALNEQVRYFTAEDKARFSGSGPMPTANPSIVPVDTVADEPTLPDMIANLRTGDSINSTTFYDPNNDPEPDDDPPDVPISLTKAAAVRQDLGFSAVRTTLPGKVKGTDVVAAPIPPGIIRPPISLDTVKTLCLDAKDNSKVTYNRWSHSAVSPTSGLYITP
jgi:hypothetical protein